MTTVAYDGTSIASDGRCTRADHEIACENTQKIIVAGKRVYAVVGTAYLIKPVIKWHEDGADPHKTPKCDEEQGWVLLVIDRTGATVYDNASPYPLPVTPPFALGSGREFAIGAMLAGASPRQAVEIACARDVWSGGTIQVVDIQEALGARPKFATATRRNPETGKNVISLEKVS